MHSPPRYQTYHPRNLNYEKDIVYVMKYNKWVLIPIGIWPSVLKGVGQFVPTITIGFTNFVLFFSVIQCTLHITLEQKDQLLRLKLLGLTCFIATTLLKYKALTNHKLNIEYCIEQVQSDWKQVEFQEERNLMLKYGKISRNLTVISAVLIYSGGLIYFTIMQYAIGSYVDEYNRTTKIFALPTYNGLYDFKQSPMYEIIYVFQYIGGYMFYTITAGTSGLVALFVTHACGQIDVVMSQLENLIIGKSSEESSNPNTRLKKIIEGHVRILRFSATVEAVLQEVCFFEVIGSTFVICLLEYYCIIDWEQKNTISLTSYAILLTSLTFNMYLLCYIGNLLLEKSNNIGRSCCMIEWYNLPSKTIQSLVLIIAMSNCPTKITAGKVVDLSLPTFGNIMKTSFAYLNFIRTATMQ